MFVVFAIMRTWGKLLRSLVGAPETECKNRSKNKWWIIPTIFQIPPIKENTFAHSFQLNHKKNETTKKHQNSKEKKISKI
jgi:hypothetical protein